MKWHQVEGIVVPCLGRVLEVSEFVVEVSSSSSVFLAVVEMRDAVEASANTSDSSKQKRIALGAVAISKRIRTQT